MMMYFSVIDSVHNFLTAERQSSSLNNKTIVTDDLMPKGVALYDYEAGNSSEISFKVSGAAVS